MGATSTRRAARGTRPSLQTPLAGDHERRPRLHARRATRVHRGGRPGLPSCARPSARRRGRVPTGWSNSWAVCSNANGYELWRRSGCGSASSAGSPAKRAGDWSANGSSPSVATVSNRLRGPAKGDPAVGAGRLEFVVASALEHHVDDRRELRVEQDADRGVPLRRSRRSGYRRSSGARFGGPIARFGRPGTRLSSPRSISRAVRCPPSLQSLPTSHAPGTSSTPTASCSAASPRGGHAAPRQAQADLGAARRLWRPRDRRQRRQARPEPAQARRQALPPPLRLPGRPHRRIARAPAGA